MKKSIISNLTKALYCVLGLSVLLASCTKEETNVAVTGVTVKPVSIMLLSGTTQKLTATVMPENAANKEVVWSSDNEAAATVSDGLVTAVAPGNATITVTTVDGNKSATCKVIVSETIVSVESVSLDKTELTVYRGEEGVKLNAIINPDNASNKNVTWASADESIATVSAEGLVEAVALGTTKVTVTTVDQGKTAECTVTVDAKEFTVKFETNGADEDIPDKTVLNGEALAEPVTPVMSGGIPGGIYVGVVDADSGSSVFAGWYTDAELTSAYDFSTPVKSDFTLYAKWQASSEPLYAGMGEYYFSDTIEWLNANAEEGKDYTVVLTENYSTRGPVMGRKMKYDEASASYKYVNAAGEIVNDNKDAAKVNYNLYVVGQTEARSMKFRWGYLYIHAGHLYLGKNATFYRENEGGEMIRIQGGYMTMLGGSKISGCILTESLGAIYIDDSNSKFYLKGGEISGNAFSPRTNNFKRCAAIVADNGEVHIESGRIGDNVVTINTTDCYAAGGFITHAPDYKANDAIVITGGIIENNKVEYAEGFTAESCVTASNVVAVRNNDSVAWGIDSNISEGTQIRTQSYDNEWASPWVKIK